MIRLARAHRRGDVGPTKTRKPRVVPIPVEVMAVLKAERDRLEEKRPGLAESGWCFATMDREGRPRLRYQTSMRKALRSWCRAAGLGRSVSPQDLRRSWVDMARQVGLDPTVRRAIVGHSGESVHDRYSTVRAEEAAEGAGRVLRLVSDGG